MNTELSSYLAKAARCGPARQPQCKIKFLLKKKIGGKPWPKDMIFGHTASGNSPVAGTCETCLTSG